MLCLFWWMAKWNKLTDSSSVMEKHTVKKKGVKELKLWFPTSVAYQANILNCLTHIIDLRPYWTVLELGNGREGGTAVAVFLFFFILKDTLDLKILPSKLELSEKMTLYQIE